MILAFLGVYLVLRSNAYYSWELADFVCYYFTKRIVRFRKWIRIWSFIISFCFFNYVIFAIFINMYLLIELPDP